MINSKKRLSKPLLVLSVLLISILTGCSTTLQKQQARHRENIPTPKISPVWPPSIFWKVITPDTTKGWNSLIDKKESEPYVYIGLSTKDYLSFTAWLNEAIIYLKSQKAIQKRI